MIKLREEMIPTLQFRILSSFVLCNALKIKVTAGYSENKATALMYDTFVIFLGFRSI
jgi:hypothetical protein